MVEAGYEAWLNRDLKDGVSITRSVWSAMLAAAPTQGGGQLSGNTGELTEAVWQAVMLGGDAWGITDRVIALLAEAPAHEGKREAVEIVTEWLAMAEAAPTRTHGAIRYPPICQGELDAIALLAALRPTDTGGEA
jgi:hypothetical protein